MIALDTNLLVYAHRAAASELASDLEVGGNRVFALQIALCAFEGGARELWSHDAHFITVAGLRLVNPLK